MGFLIYICAITFVQAATTFVDPDDMETLLVLKKHWGSLSEAMFNLILSVSAGTPWEQFADELAEIHGGMKLFLSVYVIFVMFGFLNVVIGVFVHKTAEMKNLDRDLAIQE